MRRLASSANRRQEGQTRDIDKVIPIVSDKGQAMPKRRSKRRYRVQYGSWEATGRLKRNILGAPAFMRSKKIIDRVVDRPEVCAQFLDVGNPTLFICWLEERSATRSFNQVSGKVVHNGQLIGIQ